MKSKFAMAMIASALTMPLQAADHFSTYVDSKGTISLPKDFRSNFVHLGSWAVADQKSAAHGFHDVYTERKSVEHYRKTGKFPDGATPVKETRKLETGPMPTRDPVHRAGRPAVWFVMIKDEKGRFPNNPQWEDGWGWAMYKADAPMKNVATSYKADCQTCHIPAAKTDRVFIQGYPTLKGN